jgi:hypothetical protein
MANEQLQNAPTPTMMYPKSSGIYLMSRVQELTANVADLINELVQRDARIAAMEARIAELEGSQSNVTNIKAAD